MMFTSWIRQLRCGFSGRAPGHGKHAKARAGCGLPQKRRYQPRVEVLEERSVPAVSILNGGGLGYAGNGGGGPPDVTGMAGPNSYIEVTNSTITIFSPKATGTILTQHSISDFFYNPAIGNQTLIDAPGSVAIAIAASPTGATEAGTTVTITTAVPHGFSVGQTVTISGVGVAGYNGVFPITAVTATTFTYTDATSGLANSGGGTASVDPGSCGVCDSTGLFDNLMGTNGRFIIGDIDIDSVTNVSQYIFAVSTSSNPTALDAANWNFYHVTTTQTSGGTTNWTDYPGNPGFNADAFVETFNLAHGGGLTGSAEIVSINAADLAAGVSQGSLHSYNNYITGSNSYRPTTMHDSVAGDPMWLIRNPNDGANIHVVKMTNVLSNSATFSPPTSLPLPAANNFVASGIGNPLNPNSTPMSDVGNRILKAGEYNNTIVATHAVAVGTASVVSASVRLDNMGNPIGGSGYTVGDTLTLTGGTFTTAATLTVATLGAGGSVSTVTVANPGNYSSLAGITGAVTGGTGTGAKFNLNFRGQLVVQWYAIDVSGATPAFQMVGGNPNVGRIGFGANTYCFEPAIDINSSGQIGLGFMESDTVGGAANAATGGFTSTFVTARKPTDAAGTMQPSVLVPAGTGSVNINGRVGDFSGMNVDPVNGTFWHVNEFGGGPTDIANFTPNAPPVVTPPAPQASVEGASHLFSLGSFTDPDGGPWTVDVSWGDGTPDTVFTATAPGTITSQIHTYGEEGTKTVTIKVTDTAEGQFDSKTFTVSVSDPAVVPTGGFMVAAVEGTASTPQTVATFTNPGGPESLGDYSDLIDWGDGNTSVGTITFSSGTFTVQGSHIYAEESGPEHFGSQPYSITVTISHDIAPTVFVLSTATVSDPAVIGSAVNFQQTKGVAFTNQAVATFTDPGGTEAVGDYSATIDWGDMTPTTSGLISISGSTYTVKGNHTYNKNGVLQSTVTIHHENAPDDTVMGVVIVVLPAVWTSASSMPTGFVYLAGALGSDGRIYAIGGSPDNGTTAVNTVQAYKTGVDSWSPPPPVAHLLTPREGLGAAEGLDGRIYAFGGSSGSKSTPLTFLNSVECYTPFLNKWTAVASMSTARWGVAAATGPDGRIYAIGGMDGTGTVVSSVEVYNPSTGVWSAGKPLPVPREGAAAATGPDGRIYVFGGTDGTAAIYKTVFCYYPLTNMWTQVASMTLARLFPAATLGLKGQLYVIGGLNSAFPAFANFEAYQTTSGTWSALYFTPLARYGLAAVTGNDGGIYAFGGADAMGNPLSANQVFRFSGSGPAGAPTGPKYPAEISGDLTSAATAVSAAAFPVLGETNEGVVPGTAGLRDEVEAVFAAGDDSLSADLTDTLFAGRIS